MATRRQLLGYSAATLAATTIGRQRGLAQESSPAAATPVALFDPAELPLRTAGRLTVHADQPLYAPWFIDNDPTNGQGFESAFTYALAATLGFARDEVDWGYTAWNASFAPGEKDFDFYITEVSITEARKEAVDFSDWYYQEPLVVVTKADGPVIEATSIAELRQFRFGAQVGSTYHTYIEELIQPEQDTLVYDTNADSLAALDNGTVDAVLQILQIGIYNVTIQFEGLALGGIIPGTTSNLGLVFEKGSELVPYVDAAIAQLKNDGTLEALTEEWLPLPPDLRTYTTD